METIAIAVVAFLIGFGVAMAIASHRMNQILSNIDYRSRQVESFLAGSETENQGEEEVK